MSTSTDWKTAKKAPTANGVKVMNKAERDAFRTTRKFKSRNDIWSGGEIPGTPGHRFNAYSRVGKVSELIVAARPETYNDWANWYLENVHPWETVQAHADEFYRYAITRDPSITPEEALAEHIIHILDQTWEGWAREDIAAEDLSRLLECEIGRPSYEWDVDYAVDLIRVDETAPDGFIEGFQVKPTSFFLSQGPGVVRARRDNRTKHQKAEAKGKTVWFVDGDKLHRGQFELIHWKDLPK
jgi:hypothetical protein